MELGGGPGGAGAVAEGLAVEGAEQRLEVEAADVGAPRPGASLWPDHQGAAEAMSSQRGDHELQGRPRLEGVVEEPGRQPGPWTRRGGGVTT